MKACISVLTRRGRSEGVDPNLKVHSDESLSYRNAAENAAENRAGHDGLMALYALRLHHYLLAVSTGISASAKAAPLKAAASRPLRPSGPAK